jgi:hypothetical protein
MTLRAIKQEGYPMDRTIKCLLGVIAASLLMLNLQLAGGSLVKDAHAEWKGSGSWQSDSKILKHGFQSVADAIEGIDCGD